MDVEKTMEFILTQQAQFSVDLAAHTEALAAQSNAIAAQKDNLDQFANLIMTWVERSDKRAQATEDRLGRLVVKVDQIADNMNALIRVVDGLVRRPGV